MLNRASSKQITISGRKFVLEVMMFSNGCIAVVSEGEASRLGSISLSLKGESSTSRPSPIIPGRHNESPIADILTEALTTVTSGILMVSYFAEKELLGGDLKEMVAQLKNIISEKVK